MWPTLHAWRVFEPKHHTIRRWNFTPDNARYLIQHTENLNCNCLIHLLIDCASRTWRWATRASIAATDRTSGGCRPLRQRSSCAEVSFQKTTSLPSPTLHKNLIISITEKNDWKFKTPKQCLANGCVGMRVTEKGPVVSRIHKIKIVIRQSNN